MIENPLVQRGGSIPLSNLEQRDLLTEVIARGVPFRFRAIGWSMWPFIRDHDILTVSPLANGPIRLGDVVAIIHPGSDYLMIHRTIACVGDGWLVRGDNNPYADGVVTRERIIGRVTRVEHDGRDLHLGLGAEAGAIAWLVRHNALLRAKTFYFFGRRVAAAILRRAQNLTLYRVVARRLRLHFSIIEASKEDEEKIHAHFNPGMPIPRRSPDTNVTNYVAKRGAKIVGFTQLVRHPEAHFPYVGYWLFSLEVWPRHRGFGIGQILTGRVIDHAQAEGAPELFLVVSETNYHAIALYRKLGFEHAILSGLEEKLEKERQDTGRRRIAMRKVIAEKR